MDDLTAMLAECRNNLAAFEGRMEFMTGEFGRDDIGSGYDGAVAGLAIHHLPDEDKATLFTKVHDALNPGGCFIIRDVLKGETEQLTRQYHAIWRRFVESNGTDADHHMERHRNFDTPATLSDQLQWLRDAGFSHVDCYMKYINFAVFGGRKTP